MTMMESLLRKIIGLLTWRPIREAPTGRRIVLGGPSGYNLPHDWHEETGHVAPSMPLAPFRTDSGDAYTDGWPEPTHWREAVSPPEEYRP